MTAPGRVLIAWSIQLKIVSLPSLSAGIAMNKRARLTRPRRRPIAAHHRAARAPSRFPVPWRKADQRCPTVGRLRPSASASSSMMPSRASPWYARQLLGYHRRRRR